MRRGPELTYPLGGDFNMPTHPFPAQYAFVLSFSRLDLRKPRYREEPQRAVITCYRQLPFVMICLVRRNLLDGGSPCKMGD